MPEPQKPRRSGSEKRRMAGRVSFRATFDEKARWTNLANTHGQSIGDFLRSTLDGQKPKPIRRPRSDNHAVIRLMAATADLKQAIVAEMNKQGSNFNQIAHRLNMDLPVDDPILARVAQLIADHAEMKDYVEREFIEYRLLQLQALGQDRRQPPGSDDEPPED